MKKLVLMAAAIVAVSFASCGLSLIHIFYRALNDWEKAAFNRLYDQYYYHRHNDFWGQQAMKKLRSKSSGCIFRKYSDALIISTWTVEFFSFVKFMWSNIFCASQ